MKINRFVSGKYFCTDESVKRQITDSISENSTDSDLESTLGTIDNLVLWSFLKILCILLLKN